nr:unnamed protein product [Callosobruchus chinensis]
MYWDRTIITDRKLEHHRPYIIVKGKRYTEVLLIDIAIQNNDNLKQTYQDKINKYNMDFEV